MRLYPQIGFVPDLPELGLPVLGPREWLLWVLFLEEWCLMRLCLRYLGAS